MRFGIGFFSTDQTVAPGELGASLFPESYRRTLDPFVALAAAAEGCKWPKPVQGPLPVSVGGNGDGALRRVPRYGDHWMPNREAGLAECLPMVRTGPRDVVADCLDRAAAVVSQFS